PCGLALDGFGEIRKLPFQPALAVNAPRSELTANILERGRKNAAERACYVDRRRDGLRDQVRANSAAGANGSLLLCSLPHFSLV
ncbi:hypothetical protein ACV356_32690, partial [Pseudomonas aeruginosa]